MPRASYTQNMRVAAGKARAFRAADAHIRRVFAGVAERVNPTMSHPFNAAKHARLGALYGTARR